MKKVNRLWFCHYFIVEIDKIVFFFTIVYTSENLILIFQDHTHKKLFLLFSLLIKSLKTLSIVCQSKARKNKQKKKNFTKNKISRRAKNQIRYEIFRVS